MDYAKKYREQYYLKNKIKILNNNQLYRQKYKIRVLAQKLKWQKENKYKRKIINQRYVKNNKEKILLSNKKYREKNKKIIYKKFLNKLKTDPTFKLIHQIKHRTRMALKNNSKTAPSLELLGCDAETCWKYLESKFQPGMTRKNHGTKGWHLDHFLPCISFDLSKESEQRKCFHYTNLQPLWAKDNLSKGSKSPKDF